MRFKWRAIVNAFGPALARSWGQLAFAHPFLDGNGRTILLVFMELSFRAGFAIDWSKTQKDLYLRALSDEIREPSTGHLDRYLQPFVVEISSREEWPGIISGIKGLDGLDKDGITYESLDNPEVQQIYKTCRTTAQALMTGEAKAEPES